MKPTNSLSLAEFGGYSALYQTMQDPNFNASTFTTLESCFRSHLDIPPFAPLKLLSALRVLHLSNNNIDKFNYANILNGAPNLIEIDLSYNKIKTLDDLIELGSLQNLQKLDFSQNPVCKTLPRIRIIEFLLLPKKYTSHNGVKILTACYVHVPNEARLPEEAQKKREMNAEIAAPVPWELAKCRQNQYDHGRTLIRKGMKECPVPRKTRFPMLTSLNGGIISLQDMHSILAGGDLKEILVEKDLGDGKHRAKSAENTSKVDNQVHKKYLDVKKRKVEREAVKNINDFMFKESPDKKSNKNVLDLLITADKTRSQERAAQKKQVGAKVCYVPFDVQYKDVEFNIGIQEFKEMTKKHEEKKKGAEDEALIRKKQYLVRLRSSKSNKFYIDEDEGKAALTKDEIAEVNEIYKGIYKNGVKPKLDLTQEKQLAFLESSESDLDEAEEEGLEKRNLSDSQSSTDSKQDSDNDSVEPIDLPHEMLKHFVRDVSIGKYRKSVRQKESKEDLTVVKKREGRNEENITEPGSKIKILSRFSSQIEEVESQSRSPRKETTRVTIKEDSGELTQKPKLEEEQKSDRGHSFRQKRIFMVKNESSPNLALPLKSDAERKDVKQFLQLASTSKPQEGENLLDKLSPIGKLNHNNVNVEWENSALLLDEEKGFTSKKSGHEYKGDISLLNSIIQNSGGGQMKLMNLQNFLEDQSKKNDDSSKAKMASPQDIPGFEAVTKKITSNQDIVPKIPEGKQNTSTQDHLRRIVGTKSRIRMLRSMRGMTSRSHTSMGAQTKHMDISMGESRQTGFGLDGDNDSSPISFRITQIIEAGNSNRNLESSRSIKQIEVKKRVEKLKEKQREMFKGSNKLLSGQVSESCGRSPVDLSGNSMGFSRDKTPQPNSQPNSAHFVAGHYRNSSLMKPIPEGYIALKDMYPQTVSHAVGLSNSSICKPGNISGLTEQISQRKQQQSLNDASRIAKEDPSGLESSKMDGKSSFTQDNSSVCSMDFEKRKKARSWSRESMTIIVKPPTATPGKNPKSQVQRLLVEDLLPEARDGLTERQRMKILTERGDKYESLAETGKLLEQMDILIAESNSLTERIQIKGGRRSRRIKESLNAKQDIGFSDLAQLLRQKTNLETLDIKDTKALREYINLAYTKELGLNADRIETLSRELKQKLMNGNDWDVDSASYQLNKLDRYVEFEDNLKIVKEINRIKEKPGYLDKIEREEVLRVQSDVILAAHTARIQKYCGDVYMRKYYKRGVTALEDIQTSGVKTMQQSVGENDIQKRISSIKGHKVRGIRGQGERIETDTSEKESDFNREEKVKKYAENFKQDLTRRKELKTRVETYIKDGRKTIDEFLEKQRQELNLIHDKKAVFNELVRLTWEKKA